jgi:hypothetical protein
VLADEWRAERCSGLPVRRHSPDDLALALGARFEKVAQTREEHTSPRGARQAFADVLCRRRDG